MKPLHVGLLVVGAGLAGGLAVRMSQAPAVSVAAPPATAPPMVQSGPAVVAPVASPPAPKAAPTPEATPNAVAPAAATAPAPIYEQPAKPEFHKPKPFQIAKVKPTEWAPRSYEAARGQTPSPSTPAPQPEPAAVVAPPEPAPVASEPAPPPRAELAPRQATIRTGTTIPVRISESLSSDRSLAGDTFHASLAEPLVVDGLVIAERGARVAGRIVDSQKAGRVSGTALLTLALTSIETSDGQKVAVSTDPWTKQGDTSHRQDAEKIGGGAALGAIIGAIAGGGAGAAIGAGIGGGAGAGTVLTTRGKSVSVPTETIVRFRLASRVTITEQQVAGR